MSMLSVEELSNYEKHREAWRRILKESKLGTVSSKGVPAILTLLPMLLLMFSLLL